MGQTELIERIFMYIETMQKCHKENKLLFANDEYPRHDVRYPLDSLNREKNESDDVFYLFIEVYKDICGDYPPICFYLSCPTISIMRNNMKTWDPEVAERVIGLFRISTSMDWSRRPSNLAEVSKMEDYKYLRRIYEQSKEN